MRRRHPRPEYLPGLLVQPASNDRSGVNIQPDTHTLTDHWGLPRLWLYRQGPPLHGNPRSSVVGPQPPYRLERVLLPTLIPGQIVVVDNVGAHKPERIRALVEAAGCALVFLPAYSPDLSPIEEAFSKIKALVKAAAARTRAALDRAIAAALEAVTAADIAGWFSHAGYLSRQAS